FDYLKKLTKWKDNTACSFHKALENVYDKLISIRFKIGNKRKFTKFVLFTKYTIDIEKQIIQIGLNTEFRWVLNEIAKNFTKFELEEFVDFKSSYTKEFFRRIKQFNTGKWDVSREDFKHQLNIPETYNINDIEKRIIKQILKELEKKYYLKVEKKYK
ncbi:replication initiation protein, partial [Streptobacillus moniliformis]|uniref:replication initiation protein n=1 Tax=Streptobacillus moniliformis TaxID=34105 RepID=UPI000B202966